jgi:hypothetical protein
MSGFLIDGVPFVSEGDDKGEDIQGYLDSEYPGNVNEYTTTTNTGVTTPVPGLEKHNYNALKPNLPTRYKLQDVSLNENAFAYARTFTRFQTGTINVQSRFNRATVVIRGGKGGKGGGGGEARAWWFKNGSDNRQGTAIGYGGEGGPGGFGQIAVFTQEYGEQTDRSITISTIGSVGSSGSTGNTHTGETKADDGIQNSSDAIYSGAVNAGNAGNHTTVSILDNIIVAQGGNSGDNGNRGYAQSYAGPGNKNGYATSTPGNQGAPGNTPVSNTYVQNQHGGPDQWENVGDDGFVKIYFS